MVDMHRRFRGRNFDVLAFPCNQFGNQEPGSCEEVAQFARETYGAEFDVFEKVDVNGPNTHPVFRYLKKATQTRNIPWNFGVYFLINKHGNIRAFPGVHPYQLNQHIIDEL